MPTSSSFSAVPPNQAARNRPSPRCMSVEAWHCGNGCSSPKRKSLAGKVSVVFISSDLFEVPGREKLHACKIKTENSKTVIFIYPFTLLQHFQITRHPVRQEVFGAGKFAPAAVAPIQVKCV